MPQIQEEAHGEAMGEYQDVEGKELRERAVSAVSAGRSLQDTVSKITTGQFNSSTGLQDMAAAPSRLLQCDWPE